MMCTHPTEDRYFTDDNLLEWCGLCGQVVTDHHERKFGEPHPEHFPKRGPGRPKLDAANPTAKIAVTLPASLVEKAKALGDGNASAGVRLALEGAGTMKCEHCGQTGNIKKVEIEDGYIYLCGACRGDKRTKEYDERSAK